jgi:hypothetical protein
MALVFFIANIKPGYLRKKEKTLEVAENAASYNNQRVSQSL